MARPVKDGLDYFPHDTDASNDEKVEALRALYGNNGYAFYFILLERIYRSKDFEIDVSDAETIQILARKIAVTTEEFNQILSTALKWGCFDRKSYDERGVLTSNGIKKRASVVVKKREEMRDKYQKSKGVVSDAETDQETGEETPQSKVKKSKVKKSKVKKSKDLKDKKNTYAEFVSMTEIEYQKLVDAHGEPLVKRMIEVLDNYKGSSGKKYKDDYRAILNWVVDRVKGELPSKGGQPHAVKQHSSVSDPNSAWFKKPRAAPPSV